MSPSTFREYCLNLPFAEPDFPFDENVLTFKLKGKVFAMMTTNPEGWFVLKCKPEYSIQLKESWTEIEPAWHCNKKYWIQLDLTGSLPNTLVMNLIRHSYNEVLRKFPKKLQKEIPFLEEDCNWM